MSERTWYSTRQVAELLDVHIVTIRRRIWASQIPAHQIANSGPWRVPSWWVDEEMDKRREPVRRPRRRMITLKAED